MDVFKEKEGKESRMDECIEWMIEIRKDGYKKER